MSRGDVVLRGTISFSSIRNKTEITLLNAQLKKIKAEQNYEMRMLDHEQRRFKSRYCKKKGCRNYNRNMESKETKHVRDVQSQSSPCLTQENEESSVSNFLCIHSLLFTNGEIDIDKCLCLYLLSAHRTESLSAPKCKFSHKGLTPIDKLLEKSKTPTKSDEKYAAILPLYVLEPIETKHLKEIKPENLLRDARMVQKLVINNNILTLMNSVMNALDHSNKDKLRILLDKSNDRQYMKEILGRDFMKPFLTSLRDFSTLFSHESYSLKNCINLDPTYLYIKTRTETLEWLLHNIRSKLLQTAKPVRSKKEDNLETNSERRYDSKIMQSSEKNTDVPNRLAGKDKKRAQSLNSGNLRRNSLPGEEKVIGVNTRRNFIAENIEGCSQYKKIVYDEGENGIEMRVRSEAKNGNRRGNVLGWSLNRNVYIAKKLSVFDTHSDDEDEDDIKDKLNFLR